MSGSRDIPTLVQLSSTKLAFHFWNLPDILSRIPESEENDVSVFGPGTQREVNHKVQNLPIYVVALKDEIINRARFLGSQICKWIERVKYSCPDCSQMLNQRLFCRTIVWTSDGTVDELKSIRNLIGHGSMHVEVCFRLACFFCLDDLVPYFWFRMSSRMRLYENDHNTNLGDDRTNQLLAFWIRIMLGKSVFNAVKGFEAAVSYFVGSYVGAQYFWDKLSDSEKQKQLQKPCRTSPHEDPPKFLVPFLFSKLDRESQSFLLKKVPYDVMTSLSRCQRPDMLVAVADNTTVKTLKPSDFYNFLYLDILVYAYHLFEDIWLMASDVQKSFVLSRLPAPNLFYGGFDYDRLPIHDASQNMVCKLFIFGNELGLRLLLKHLDTEQRDKIVEMHYRGRNICVDLIVHQKWDLLKFYGREFVTSMRAVSELEQQLDEYFEKYPEQMARAGEWPLVKHTFFEYVSFLLDHRVPGMKMVISN